MVHLDSSLYNTKTKRVCLECRFFWGGGWEIVLGYAVLGVKQRQKTKTKTKTKAQKKWEKNEKKST